MKEPVNLVGEYYKKQMTIQEAYDLFPNLDLLVVSVNPEDVCCQDIILYGVADANNSYDLLLKFLRERVKHIECLYSNCRSNPLGELGEGFVGVQLWKKLYLIHGITLVHH